MSTKSRSGVVTVPDLPFREFSPLLESHFECLHRLLCSSLTIPDSVSSIAVLCEDMRKYYYRIRELLEDDFGIAQSVADCLPIPKTTEIIKRLYAWETCEVGDAEFQARSKRDETTKFSRGAECWNEYRWCVYESDRVLRITWERIAVSAPGKQPRRYPWLGGSRLVFDG